MTESRVDTGKAGDGERRGRAPAFAWILAGAAYGICLRVVFDLLPAWSNIGGVMTVAFLLGVPFAIGAITVYGRRHDDPSLLYMIFAPWLTVGLTLLGCAVTMLEGSICIALMSPLFVLCGSAGGIVMGLILHFGKARTPYIGSVAALPFVLLIAESFAPLISSETEIRDSVVIDASPQTVWDEIMTAESIRPDELPWSLSHTIGVPKPVEGVNRMTPDGEIRYSRWERGVRFEALVTERRPYETIHWDYSFDAHSFPKGSMDEHVEIGGKFFGLEDTTFNFEALPDGRTELELVAHYRVSSSINFYAVPVAKVLGHDFVNTILGLYKGRSEAATAASR